VPSVKSVVEPVPQLCMFSEEDASPVAQVSNLPCRRFPNRRIVERHRGPDLPPVPFLRWGETRPLGRLRNLFCLRAETRFAARYSRLQTRPPNLRQVLECVRVSAAFPLPSAVSSSSPFSLLPHPHAPANPGWWGAHSDARRTDLFQPSPPAAHIFLPPFF